MRRRRLSVVVFLACAVCVAVIVVRWRGRTDPPESLNVHEPALPDAIRLPVAVAGTPITTSVPNAILLHVNRDGEVIPPFDRAADTKPLRDLAQIEDYLRRRADIEKREIGKDTPHGMPILRIDRETPFDKTYPTMKACLLAGYEKYQLRVLRPVDMRETQIPLTFFQVKEDVGIPSITDEMPHKFIIRCETTETGQISGITFREEGSADDSAEVWGAELSAVGTKLRTVVEYEKQRIARAASKGAKIPLPQLTLEIPDRLRQNSVVQLLDEGLSAGFGEVWLVPVDPAKR